MTTHRFYVRSPDGKMMVGYDDVNVAKAVALEYGEGAHLVDNRAQAYHPIAQEVSDGELSYVEIGGWGAGKFTVERNLIESIKKGHAAIVHAFLAKGADPERERRRREPGATVGGGPRQGRDRRYSDRSRRRRERPRRRGHPRARPRRQAQQADPGRNSQTSGRRGMRRLWVCG